MTWSGMLDSRGRRIRRTPARGLMFEILRVLQQSRINTRVGDDWQSLIVTWRGLEYRIRITRHRQDGGIVRPVKDARKAARVRDLPVM